MVLAIATYFTYFGNNNGLSNVGIFILYFFIILIILAAIDTKKKKNPNPLDTRQKMIVVTDVLIAFIAIYSDDFITGGLFIITAFLTVYIIKNN